MVTLASVTLVLPSFTTSAPGPEFSGSQLAFAAVCSLALLLVALVAAVGLAKVESPSIEHGVEAAGFPAASVGVVIALLVLLPESIAAVRAAAREDVQILINPAYGSAMASIGLTIPTIAVATLVVDDPLALGLDPLQIVLLAAFVFLSVQP